MLKKGRGSPIFELTKWQNLCLLVLSASRPYHPSCMYCPPVRIESCFDTTVNSESPYNSSVAISNRTIGIGLSVHTHKKGIRALGISESFRKGISKHSILAGVVMRADMIIDGFTFSEVAVGGMDATHKIIEMYEALDRKDINTLLLNGCVISWYNVIDLNYVVDTIGLPLICVTYRDSKGLETFLKENFPDEGQRRIEVYKKNGPRTPLTLHTGHTIYARFLNISKEETSTLLDRFTFHGAIPEPLRIARLLARSLMRRSSAHAHAE